MFLILDLPRQSQGGHISFPLIWGGRRDPNILRSSKASKQTSKKASKQAAKPAKGAEGGKQASNQTTKYTSQAGKQAAKGVQPAREPSKQTSKQATNQASGKDKQKKSPPGFFRLSPPARSRQHLREPPTSEARQHDTFNASPQQEEPFNSKASN